MRNPPVTGGFLSQRASSAENGSILWRHHGHTPCLDRENESRLHIWLTFVIARSLKQNVSWTKCYIRYWWHENCILTISDAVIDKCSVQMTFLFSELTKYYSPHKQIVVIHLFSELTKHYLLHKQVVVIHSNVNSRHSDLAYRRGMLAKLDRLEKLTNGASITHALVLNLFSDKTST